MKRLLFVFLIALAFLQGRNSVYAQGEIWGMTTYGGASGLGVIFKTSADGSNFSVEYEFQTPTPGAYPDKSRMTLVNGKLYGITAQGGIFDKGVLFEYTPSTNIYTRKVDFTGLNGMHPNGGLTLASNGKLYGVTENGGTLFNGAGFGTLFEFDPLTGAFETKVVFDSNVGWNPMGLLAVAPDGTLYGMCRIGNSSAVRIYQYNVTTNVFTGKLDIPYGTQGSSYYGNYKGLTTGDNGKLYGTTVDPSGFLERLIEYDPVTNTYAYKHTFDGGYNGGGTTGISVKGSNGKLYGLTTSGGSNNAGMLFEYNPVDGIFTKKIDFTSSWGPFIPGGPFPEPPTGSPVSDLTEFENGKLIGQTANFGGGGIIFEYNFQSSTFTKKFTFPTDGNYNNYATGGTTLAMGGNNKVYGMHFAFEAGFSSPTFSVGAKAGEIFEFDPSTNGYAKKVVLNSSQGGNPWGSLVELNGKFYSTTSTGGSRGVGCIFEYDPSTKVYTKKADLQNHARSGLVAAANGKLYGATWTDFFEYDPSNNSVTNKGQLLYYYDLPLLLASNGKIYGCSRGGGANDKGFLFEFDPATSLFVQKAQFGGVNGNYPATGLTEGDNGKLYGYNYSNTSGADLYEYDFLTETITFFKYHAGLGQPSRLVNGRNGKLYGYHHFDLVEYNPSDNSFTSKYWVGSTTNGHSPVGELLSSPSGILYGMTAGGGTNNIGVFFAYNPVTNQFTKKMDWSGYNGLLPAGELMFTPKVTQTIAFNPIPPKTYADADFVPDAIASSNLQVALTSSNPAVATTQGNVIKIVGLGSAVITATQSGDNAFLPAAPVQQTLVVTKATATATATAITKVYGDAIPPLTIAYSGLKAGETGSVIDTPPVTSTTATQTSDPGTYPISITGGSDNNYNLTLTAGTLTITKVDQTITFAPLSDKLVGDPDFNLLATSTSGLTVSYSSSDPSVATISGNTVTIIASGTTTITASQTGNIYYNAAPNVPLILTVNKGPQIITFNALSAKTYGDAPFLLAATASSGLPVTYTSSDPSVATVSGNTVTITGAGETTITASQPGNTHWYAAPDVPQTLTVNKANQAITFSTLTNKTYGDLPFTLTATSTSGLPVSFVSGDPAVATISGTTVTIVGGGATTITASQAGNSNYNAATNVAQTLTVNQAPQSITFNALPVKNYGDVPFTISATATSGLGIVFTSSDPAVATVSGNTLTITGGGTTTITASQPGNTNFSAAADVPRILIVNKINQTITFSALVAKTYGNAPYTLAATTASGLPITYTSSDPAVLTIVGNTVTIVGAGSATITASQPGNANYNSAVDVARTQTVNKANQTITFATPPTKTYTSPAFAFAGTVTSGLPITYSIVDPAVATVSGVTCTIVGVGVTQVTATQPGNANYNAAAPITRTLTVTKASQTITFAAISNKTYGGAPFTLTATSTSGLPVSYSSSNTSIITISGNVATIVGAGTVTLTASQVGDGNYNAAAPVNRNVVVGKAAQTITFLTLPNKAYGDAPFNLTGTATSGLALTYVSSNTSVATVSGDQVTIVGVGTSTITASQAGNANYNAATAVARTLTVTKGNQTITFDPLANVQYGDAAFTLSATASSGLGVTYTSSAPSVATVSGNTVTIMGVGTTTITASQAGNTLYFAATSVARTLTVNKASQTISFSPLASVQYNDPSFSLTASASSGLPVSFISSNPSVATVSGTTVTIIGVGSTTITASQAGNALYDVAPAVQQTLIVDKDDQAITFNALASKTFGDVPFTVSATASSGLSVTFSSSNTSVATVSGTTVTIVGAGSATITASQSGSALYNTATPVGQILDVAKMAQTITFGSLTDKIYGDVPFTVSATASSGLAVTFSSTNTAAATVSGNTVTIVGPGTATIVASQGGDANYQSAADIAQNFTITLPAPTELPSYVDIYNITSSGMTIEFFPGDGNKRLVIMKPVTPVNFTPVNNNAYALNYTVNGNVVVMNDAGSLVNVPGLLSDTKYFIKIIEYNEVGSFTSYMTTGATATARTAVGFSGFVASGSEQSSEEGELAVRVMNNPFKTRLSILIETPKEEDALIGLLDLNGKVIHSSVRKTKKQIDIEEPVVNGIYMLRVRTGTKSKMIRVVRMD